MSNSGGVGKTTVAAHLAYSLAKKGYKPLVIELDQQDSFRLSTGLGIADLDRSAAKIFRSNFKEEYPIVQIWYDPQKLVSYSIELQKRYPDLKFFKDQSMKNDSKLNMS